MPILYTSQYPIQDTDHVKATNYYSVSFYPHFTTDPSKPLTGGATNNCWLEDQNSNMRFHIDLSSAKIIRRIYYENYHDSGGATNAGVKNFTFWGSNTGPGVFDDLVYSHDEGWTQLDTSPVSTLDKHSEADEADPKHITVDNSVAYRYYAFKFSDNYGSSWIGVRRIELQTEDGYPPTPKKDASRTGIYTFKTLKI